jgi:hypothetical protein
MHARRAVHGIQFLNVVGYDDARYGALRRGDAHGSIDHMASLCGRNDGLHISGDIAEQLLQIHFLLIVAA